MIIASELERIFIFFIFNYVIHKWKKWNEISGNKSNVHLLHHQMHGEIAVFSLKFFIAADYLKSCFICRVMFENEKRNKKKNSVEKYPQKNECTFTDW